MSLSEVQRDALLRWLSDAVPGLSGAAVIERFPGGRSNPTYRVAIGRTELVVRTKPPGELLPSAHALDREYRVLTALGSTALPVPCCHGYCRDRAVIGTEFFVMDFAGGRVFVDAALTGVHAGERAAISASLADTLARLHGVDPATIGLSDYGAPGSYLRRQLGRWTAQYRAGTAGPLAAMDRLIDALPARLPAEESRALVHGDFRVDNVVIAPDRPEVVAVLDWELSTLGDPLADLAHHALSWILPPELYRFGIAGSTTPGIPSLAEHLGRYLDAAGRTDLPHWDIYLAFALFRLAAIHHGIQSRAQHGNAASHDAAVSGAHSAEIALLALDRLGAARRSQ